MIFNVPRGISQVKGRRRSAAGLHPEAIGHTLSRAQQLRGIELEFSSLPPLRRGASPARGPDCAWSLVVKEGMMNGKTEIFGIEFGFDYFNTIIFEE